MDRFNGWREGGHDPQSLQHPVFPLASAPTSWPSRSAQHPCKTWLDQGDEGACVGFSTAHFVAAAPHPRVITGADARSIYTTAKTLDPFDGDNYPGTTLLAGMKAAQQQNRITAYRWLFGAIEVAHAVATISPVVLGIPWHAGMRTPNTAGVIVPTGERVGGHAILCNGYNARTGMFRLHNSWGRMWGVRGDCYLHRDHLAHLLAGIGEATIPTKRTTLS